jgi:hypothetical protein
MSIAIIIRNILVEIAENAYPNVKHVKFYITYNNKMMASRHGDWREPFNGDPAIIRIVNLDRPSQEIIKTSIHELAHNVDYSIRYKTNHDRTFYKVYKTLIETAIAMDLIEIKDIKNSNDIKRMVKHHGDIRIPSEKIKSEYLIVKVKNSYQFKDELKSKGFKFSAIEKTWNIEMKKDELEYIMTYLLQFTTLSNIIVNERSNIQINIPVKLIVLNAEKEYREELESLGYKLTKINGSIFGYFKKIDINDVDTENNKLDHIPNISVFLSE